MVFIYILQVHSWFNCIYCENNSGRSSWTFLTNQQAVKMLKCQKVLCGKTRLLSDMNVS